MKYGKEKVYKLSIYFVLLENAKQKDRKKKISLWFADCSWVIKIITYW